MLKMSIRKELRDLQIKPIEDLLYKEKDILINNIATKFINAFPKLQLDYNDLLNKLHNCNMVKAEINSKLGTANYFYKNNTIYISKCANIENPDEFVIHEFIHYLQDQRTYDGKLKRMGLCTFQEFKIYGLALNEAAVQYITAKLLNKKEEVFEFLGMRINTVSNNYYPFLCALLNQIIFLIGEDVVIESTLKNNDEFAETFSENIGEDTYYIVEQQFDTILNTKQKILELLDNKIVNEKLIIKKQHDLKEQFLNAQKTIFKGYFDNFLYRIDTLDEVELYKEKLNEYIKIIYNRENDEFYDNYMSENLKKLDRKVLDIHRKNSRSNLIVFNENKIFAVIRAIKNLLFKSNKNYDLNNKL